MSENTNEPKTHKHKRYDLSFNARPSSTGFPAANPPAVVAELGICGQTFKTWKQQLSVVPPPSQAQTFELLQEENGRLPRTAGRAAPVRYSKKPLDIPSPNRPATL